MSFWSWRPLLTKYLQRFHACKLPEPQNYSSQGIYVIAWKSVSCTHMEMSFFGKKMDSQHAITWTNSCNGMTHGVMQVNRCPDCTVANISSSIYIFIVDGTRRSPDGPSWYPIEQLTSWSQLCSWSTALWDIIIDCQDLYAELKINHLVTGRTLPTVYKQAQNT